MQAEMRKEQKKMRKEQAKAAEAERKLAGVRAKNQRETARRIRAERKLAAAEAEYASLLRSAARLSERVDELERRRRERAPPSRVTPAQERGKPPEN